MDKIKLNNASGSSRCTRTLPLRIIVGQPSTILSRARQFAGYAQCPDIRIAFLWQKVVALALTRECVVRRWHARCAIKHGTYIQIPASRQNSLYVTADGANQAFELVEFIDQDCLPE